MSLTVVSSNASKAKQNQCLTSGQYEVDLCIKVENMPDL